jgi:hypothetical protein
MWFKLDDRFYDHPKVLDAGNAAVGLWARCASWSAGYESDGVIPSNVARTFGTRREIDALTSSRLWVPIGDAYVIRDYLSYNIGRAELVERRAVDAERKRRQRETGARAVGRDGVSGRFARPTGQTP